MIHSSFWKQSLLGIVFVFCSAHASTPSIIWLRGSSPSGKTSIIKSLKSMNVDWCFLEEDEVFTKQIVEKLTVMFPEEMKQIALVTAPNNVWAVIKKNERCFVRSAKKKDKKTALEAISKIQQYFQDEQIEHAFHSASKDEQRTYMRQEAAKALARGQNVVITGLYFTPEDYGPELAQYRRVIALAFCPLEKALQRFAQRNARAATGKDLSDARYFRHAIRSFVRYYQLTRDSKNTLHVCKKSEINALFDDVGKKVLQDNDAVEIDKGGFVWKELNQYRLKKFREELIPAPLSSEEETFYVHLKDHVHPKEQYDIILNSEHLSPLQCAQVLVRFTGS